MTRSEAIELLLSNSSTKVTNTNLNGETISFTNGTFLFDNGEPADVFLASNTDGFSVVEAVVTEGSLRLAFHRSSVGNILTSIVGSEQFNKRESNSSMVKIGEMGVDQLGA